MPYYVVDISEFGFGVDDYDVSYPEIIINDINIDTFEFGVGVYVKEWGFENFDEDK